MKPFRSKQSVHSLRGFTLVEVMIVIVIIITLVALGFIGIRTMKERAAATVDANDLRKIHVALYGYTAEHNDKLPYTMSGISPTFREGTQTLNTALAPYLGYEDARNGDFFPEFAAASWQKATKNPGGPSLLVHQLAYTGPGKWTGNPMRPDPSTTTFGYPGQRDPKTVSAVMSLMTSASNSIMLSEIDREHPEFSVSKPTWLQDIPDGMAHGSYRLGLFWDGHVGKLDKDLNPM